MGKKEGLDLQNERHFQVSKISEKLARGTWFRLKPYGHKPVEEPLSLAKRIRMEKALDELRAAIERDNIEIIAREIEVNSRPKAAKTGGEKL